MNHILYIEYIRRCVHDYRMTELHAGVGGRGVRINIPSRDSERKGSRFGSRQTLVTVH